MCAYHFIRTVLDGGKLKYIYMSKIRMVLISRADYNVEWLSRHMHNTFDVALCVQAAYDSSRYGFLTRSKYNDFCVLPVSL